MLRIHVVNPNTTRSMTEKAAGADAELLLLEGAGHGFKGADAAKADEAMLAFFAKNLKK